MARSLELRASFGGGGGFGRGSASSTMGLTLGAVAVETIGPGSELMHPAEQQDTALTHADRQRRVCALGPTCPQSEGTTRTTDSEMTQPDCGG